MQRRPGYDYFRQKEKERIFEVVIHIFAIIKEDKINMINLDLF